MGVMDPSEVDATLIKAISPQGSWIYKYWNVEQSLKTNLDTIMTLVLDIIEDELKQYAAKSRDMSNPITVWAPERGDIQAEIHLPVEVKSLDEVPDVRPLVEKIEKFLEEVAVYLPDQKTWENFKESVSEILPTSQVKGTNTVEELTQLKPAKKIRAKKYKMRKYSQ